MIYDQVLIRFGDLMLKGKNRHTFINKTINLIRQNIKDTDVEMIRTHDRVYLKLNNTSEEEIKERLMRVSGIGSFSFVKTSEKEIEKIAEASILVLNDQIKQDTTFKIETKRADKRYYLTSQEITQTVAPLILPHINQNITVNVRNPEKILFIEVREEKAYIFLDSIKALGGFPVGVAGKGMLMLSGGIDSPVAALLAMKQGILIEGIHFESTPLTSIESVQKVIDIGKQLAYYTPKHQFYIHMVPFIDIHQQILSTIPDSYVITVMRRMMFKISERLAEIKNGLAIITGESVGQVASQTLQSMKTIETVTNIPILRPLVTYDKQDIINISKEINTFDISIRPFEDCCTIYVPKSPSTAPTARRAESYERHMINIEELIEEAVLQTKTFIVTPNTDLELASHGFTVKEVWDVIKDDRI